VALCILGGIALLILPFSDLGKTWDPGRVMLALWVVGTFIFAALLNWITNARSILPLIPAAAILLACRVERVVQARGKLFWPKLICGLGFAAIVTFWVCAADAGLAQSAQKAAAILRDRTGNQSTVWFAGHSGFQYYMENNAAKPLDFDALPKFRSGDFIVIPDTATNFFGVRKELVASQEIIELTNHLALSTFLPEQGADFYSGGGPLPFLIGRVPPQKYELLRLVTP
jgi:hypothetical protein